ncbi:hypothetical protein U1Q18_010213 [Sarracenia purpurea var. burkii]
MEVSVVVAMKREILCTPASPFGDGWSGFGKVLMDDFFWPGACWMVTDFFWPPSFRRLADARWGLLQAGLQTQGVVSENYLLMSRSSKQSDSFAVFSSKLMRRRKQENISSGLVSRLEEEGGSYLRHSR